MIPWIRESMFDVQGYKGGPTKRASKPPKGEKGASERPWLYTTTPDRRGKGQKTQGATGRAGRKRGLPSHQKAIGTFVRITGAISKGGREEKRKL